MQRRSFILGSGLTLAGLASGAGYWRWQEIKPTVHYPGRDLGHQLRDHAHQAVWSSTSAVRKTRVLIIGSGVAGLTAAWRLNKSDCQDLLMLQGPEPFGNSAGTTFGMGPEQIGCPTGAHYLPLPSMESRHVRELLFDLGVIEANPYDLQPSYDERALVHAPDERLLVNGQWQEGLLPLTPGSSGITANDLAEHQRFLTQMAQWRELIGSDGKKVFAIPLVLSSQDAAWRALDQLSFADWLRAQGYQSAALHWYANYCCRDDYGQTYDKISAWAGLHFFCSRGGQAANAERGAVLTWPNGLQTLTQGLFDHVRLHERSLAMTAMHIDEQADGVRVLAWDHQQNITVQIQAEQVICAMPLFIAQRIVRDADRYGLTSAPALPPTVPWLVSNFWLKHFPAEINEMNQSRDAVPLAWDNVVYGGKGLGYVVATHQQLRVGQPRQTVFTAYHALSDQTPQEARQWLNQASAQQLLKLASADLHAAYDWRFNPQVLAADITVRAHAMASPVPGFLSHPILQTLRESGVTTNRNANGNQRRLHFAHSDLSGMSLFEEASWWGDVAARAVMDDI